MKEELEELMEIIAKFNSQCLQINSQFEKIRQEYHFYHILEDKTKEIAATNPTKYFEELYHFFHHPY
jgi:hypothetical protein